VLWAIVVSATSMASRDESEVVQSNVSFVNALFGELLRPDEMLVRADDERRVLAGRLQRAVESARDRPRDGRARRGGGSSAYKVTNAPRDLRLIRALCERAGHAFGRRTAASPMSYGDDEVWGYFFVTDRGPHYMVDLGTRALMFPTISGRVVGRTAMIVEIEVSEVP
jgi:hypothetical protein